MDTAVVQWYKCPLDVQSVLRSVPVNEPLFCFQIIFSAYVIVN